MPLQATYTEVETLIDRFFDNLQAQGLDFLWPFFLTLRLHGFRVNEMVNYKTWRLEHDSLVRIPTSKRGNERIISIEEFPPEVALSIEHRKPYFYTAPYKTIDNYFVRCFPRRLYVGDKPIRTHIFRHQCIKKLHLNKLTPEDIRRKMGIRSITTVEGYLSSNILYEASTPSKQ